MAGANGSGKTRLKDAIIQTFRDPRVPQIEITIQSTREKQESAVWGSEEITLIPGTQHADLKTYMETRKGGGTYTGSVIQIDSNRSVQPITFQPIVLATPDPDDEEIAHTYFLDPFTERWQQIVNKIFQKVASRDNKIAQYVKANTDKTNAETLKRFPDPFAQYQKIFEKLLPDKKLESIDPKQLQEFHYTYNGSDRLPFTSLSSGEQEVVKIAFNLAWKKISHCIIFIDEPELHLHPTLTFRLIETLKEIGKNTNQFIFLTHSADLISTYYSTGDVYFIDSDSNKGNQAHRLRALDEHHLQIARAVGSNLGLFAVGKNLVFIEGDEASIDRLTYHKLSQISFPDAYMLPTGPVENVLALNRLSDELQRSIFGIEFFMIRDRDGLTSEQVGELEKNPRLRCLRKRHVENYYLDAEVLALVAKQLYLAETWHDQKNVAAKLKEIAKSVLSRAVLLSIKQHVTLNGTIGAPKLPDAHKKTDSDIESEFIASLAASEADLTGRCGAANITKLFAEERTRLKRALMLGTWKSIFPGKLIFNEFCGELGESKSRIRQVYIDIALEKKPKVFSEIQKIFENFKSQT